MSRTIPRVKTWRVTYWRIRSKPIVNGIIREKLASCVVQTINKRFAKWIAREQIGYPIIGPVSEYDYVHVTVSIMREKKVGAL